MLPRDAHAAATLDGAAMTWPFAIPFVGLLLSIATGPLLFPSLARPLRQDRRRLCRWSTLCARDRLGLDVRVHGRVRSRHPCSANTLSFIVLLFALYTVAGGILVTGDVTARRDQHRDARARHADGKRCRDDRRGDDPDPPADPRQRRAQAQCPCRDLLHHPGRQCRRRADARSAIRRSSSASCAASTSSGPRGISARDRLRCRRAARGVLRARQLALARRESAYRPQRDPTPPAPIRVRGLVNLVLIAAIVGAIILSRRPGGRALSFDVFGTKLELQNLVRDGFLCDCRAPFALVDARRASRGERLHLGADQGGGKAVCRRSSSTIIPVLAMLDAGRRRRFRPALVRRDRA